MIYLIHGSDTQKVTSKVQALVETLHTKRPDAELFVPEKNELNHSLFEELTMSQGLFERKYIVRIDSASEVLDEELLSDALLLCKDSENVFLFKEGTLTAPIKKIFEKYAEKVWECDAKEKVATARFNTFALTDAVGERNKGKAWALFEEAKRSGISPEEIHGVLWWQIKTMLLVSKTSSASEAGLKPFVYSKTKKALQYFSEAEIEELPSKLLRAYTRARTGNVELSVGLEKFLLEL